MEVLRAQKMRTIYLSSTLWRLVNSGIRSLTWSKVLILVAFSLSVIVSVTLVKWHLAALKLSRLLDHEFLEMPNSRSRLVGIDTKQARDWNGYPSGPQQSENGAIDYFEPSNCPQSIASLPNYSKWFRDRFKPNIKIFLDENDINNSKNETIYDLPYGLNNENLTLLSNILRHPNFKNPSLRHLRAGKVCLSCAVVGSGGILNGSYAGREIDSHDVVFRLNNAVTSGKHTESVGQKTDFYIFFPESAHLNNFKNTNVILLYAMFNSFDMNYVANIYGLGRRNHQVKADPGKIKIINPNFFRYVFTKYLDGRSMKPTTGAIAVLLAMHLCDSVTIYGFGYDPRYTMHYYDTRFTKRTYESTWTHDVQNEKRLWNKLHDEGAIRYFKRDT